MTVGGKEIGREGGGLLLLQLLLLADSAQIVHDCTHADPKSTIVTPSCG